MKDFIPVLSRGKHESPENGACVMEMVAFMSGDEWTDKPACTATTITLVAQAVNDHIDDADRHMILDQFDRLFNTYDATIEFEGEVQKYFRNMAKNFIDYQADEIFRVRLDRAIYRGDYRSIVSTMLSMTGLYPQAKGYSEFGVKMLRDVLDIYDRVMGRETVEKKDMSVLATLPGQLVNS